MSVEEYKTLVKEYDAATRVKDEIDAKMGLATIGKVIGYCRKGSDQHVLRESWQDASQFDKCATLVGSIDRRVGYAAKDKDGKDLDLTTLVANMATDMSVSLSKDSSNSSDLNKTGESKDDAKRSGSTSEYPRVFEIADHVSLDAILADSSGQVSRIREELFRSKTITLKASRVTAILTGGVYVPNKNSSLLLSLHSQFEGGQLQLPDNFKQKYSHFLHVGKTQEAFAYSNEILAFRAPFPCTFRPITRGFRVIVSFDIEVMELKAFESKLEESRNVYSYPVYSMLESKVGTSKTKKMAQLADKIADYANKRQSVGIVLKFNYTDTDPTKLRDVDHSLYEHLITIQNAQNSQDAKGDRIRGIEMATTLIRNFSEVIHLTRSWKQPIEFLPSSSLMLERGPQIASVLIVTGCGRPPSHRLSEDQHVAKRAKKGDV